MSRVLCSRSRQRQQSGLVRQNRHNRSLVTSCFIMSHRLQQERHVRDRRVSNKAGLYISQGRAAMMIRELRILVAPGSSGATVRGSCPDFALGTDVE